MKVFACCRILLWKDRKAEAVRSGELMQREIKVASYMLVGVAGAAGLGVGRLLSGLRDTSQEQKRQEAISLIKQQIRRAYPISIADSLIEAFEASDHDPTFDFNGLAKKLLDAKLYQFLFFNVGETFADNVLQKADKLARYGISLELSDLLQRVLDELNMSELTGVQLASKLDAGLFDELISQKMSDFVENGRLFDTDKGTLIWGSGKKCVLLNGDAAACFEDEAAFSKRYPDNRKMDYIRYEPVRSERLRSVAAKVIPLLYR